MLTLELAKFKEIKKSQIMQRELESLLVIYFRLKDTMSSYSKYKTAQRLSYSIDLECLQVQRDLKMLIQIQGKNNVE